MLRFLWLRKIWNAMSKVIENRRQNFLQATVVLIYIAMENSINCIPLNDQSKHDTTDTWQVGYY